MITIMEVQMDDDIVFVEIDPSIQSREVEASRQSKENSRIRESFDQALKTIRASANQIVKAMKSLSQPPTEFEVEFGLKIDGELGAVVARTLTSAHYVVKLTWRRTRSSRATKS